MRSVPPQYSSNTAISTALSKWTHFKALVSLVEMQIHCDIWAWFIGLLQSACPQQGSVVRIKGYTIWKRSIRHLSLCFPFSSDDCQIRLSFPYEDSHLFLLFTAPCLSSQSSGRALGLFNMLFRAGLKSLIFQLDITVYLLVLHTIESHNTGFEWAWETQAAF